MNYDQTLSIELDDCSLEEGVEKLQEFGCLVVRNAVPPEPLAAISACVDEGYQDLQRRHDSGSLTELEMRRCYSYGILRPFETDYRLEGGQLARDAMQDVVRNSKLAGLLRLYLGEDLMLLLEACHVRRQSANQLGRPVPLHQDCSVMRMSHGRLLNFWVPLVDRAGEDAPGLELLPKRLDRVIRCNRQADGAELRSRMYSNFEILDEDLREVSDQVGRWRPVLNRGDVLCLDGWTVHRTHFVSSMTRERRDFELRFCRRQDHQETMPGSTLEVQFDQWAA